MKCSIENYIWNMPFILYWSLEVTCPILLMTDTFDGDIKSWTLHGFPLNLPKCKCMTDQYHSKFTSLPADLAVLWNIRGLWRLFFFSLFFLLVRKKSCNKEITGGKGFIWELPDTSSVGKLKVTHEPCCGEDVKPYMSEQTLLLGFA